MAIHYSLLAIFLILAAMEWKSFNNSWRTRISYLSTVVSISLVLFVVGLVGFVVLNIKPLADTVKEHFVCSIYIKEEVKEVDLNQFKKFLDAQDYILSTHLIDKDSAAAILQADLGENEQFMDLTDGKNPLPVSIDVKIKADYTNPDSLKVMEAVFLKNPIVTSVEYDAPTLQIVHSNLAKINSWLLSISAVLLIIAIALINNTLRIKVYSQRFVIRTMQLIGAKGTFILRPFIVGAVVQGIVAALLAILMMMGFNSFLMKHFPELGLTQVFAQNTMIYLGMIAIGILITFLSTIVSVSKFLRMRTDELYY